MLTIACKETKTENKMENQISYAVTVNAPKGYPVEVHIGYLLDSNKKLICGMPKAGKTNGDWYFDGAAAGMGGRSIPHHLNLTYVAYAEKKFYEVDAPLPADKIEAAFKKGYDHEERNGDIVHLMYDYLTVGAAPGGVIIVWLGGDHNRTEICRLQAKEVVVSPDDFYRNPQEYNSQQFLEAKFISKISDSIKADIASKGIPYGRWDRYRERFKYRFVMQPYDEKDHFTLNYYTYFNGEMDELLPKELDKQAYYEKAVPYKCKFIFTKYSTEVIFNAQEMFEVFGKFKTKYPGMPMDVIVKPTFNYDSMKLSVQCEEETIPLTKYKVRGVWGG
jgi:hypothetical protein